MGSPQTASRPAFEHLYEEYRNRIHAFCLRRVGHNDAADALSEVFLAAWRRIDDVPDEPLTLPYLYGVARKVLANQRRGRSRRQSLQTKLVSLGVSPPEEPETVVVRRQPGLVEAAIRNLNTTDRELVMLDVWEELGRAEIAEIMGMKRATVNQRLRRAYTRLGRTLKASQTIESTPPLTDTGGSK